MRTRATIERRRCASPPGRPERLADHRHQPRAASVERSHLPESGNPGSNAHGTKDQDQQSRACRGRFKGLTFPLKIHESNTVTKPTQIKEAIRAAMDHLIDRTARIDVDVLETIYHRDFHTTLIMPGSTVGTCDKQEFIAHLRKQAEQAKTQLKP